MTEYKQALCHNGKLAPGDTVSLYTIYGEPLGLPMVVDYIYRSKGHMVCRVVRYDKFGKETYTGHWSAGLLMKVEVK